MENKVKRKTKNREKHCFLSLRMTSPMSLILWKDCQYFTRTHL